MESLHGSRASAVALLAALLVPAIALAQDPATAPAPGTTQPDTATTPPPAAEQGTTPASPAPPPSAAPGAMTAPPESTTPPQTAAEGESPKGSRKLGEEIVVTGSRIRRKELTSPAPVAVIGREQIQSSGRITVGDFLQAIPEQGNAINTTFNNGGNGSTEISLRNLGSQRTLVLVDGKRFISGTPGGGSLADPGADLNSIPTAAIERIEILKDGASALYGSDAIGGVVNIITRKHFNAVEASATQSLTQHGDGSVTDLNLIGGAASDEGGFSLGVGYFKQNSLAASARDWARFAQGFDYAAQTEAPAGSATAPAGSALVDPSKCSTPLCTALAGAYGAGANTFVPVAGGATAPAGFPVVTVPGVGSWRKFNPATDTYNFQAVNFLITPSDRFSLYGNGDYKLGGGARAYFHSTLVNRQSSTQLAPEPMVANAFGTALSAQNEFNPFGIDVGGVRRRLIESGGRTQAFDVDTVQLIAGIDGTLSDAAGPLGNWGYDVSFNFARNNTTVTTGGSLNTQLVAQAFGPSANGQCLTTAGDVIPGCFAANPFGLVNGQTLTPAQVASLGGFTGINHGGNQMAMVELNLNGELPVTLMADRPLGLAMGYAYRSEYGFFTFNPIAVTNNDSDFSGTNAAGRFHVNEVYGELSVPVISGMSYVEALELQAAVRYSNYNTFGGTTTYKFGARYTPVRDVTFRGTYSTGFRAPGITSLFGGSTPNAEAATDPCANGVNPNSPLGQQCAQNLKRGGGGAVALNNGDPSTQINSTSGANPALQPEKADIYTAGIVLEPRSLLRNFTFTADYFHVKVNQNITSITTPVILAGCYSGTATNNQAFCDLIQRNTDGSIFDVTDVLQNVGTETIQGLDISARYGIPTSVGRFNISADSTLLFQHDQVLADGTVIKGLNTYDLFVNPTAKFNLGVGYNVGGFLAAVRGRFVTGFHECADPDGVSSGSGLCYKNNLQADGTPFPVHNIPFYDVYDVHLSYALRLGTGTTTISAGIRNVLNKDPPRVYNTVAQTNSDPSTYDYLGRNYYAQLAHRF